MKTRRVNAGPVLVSIVIPCHNYGRYVSEAIESALAQTHRPVEVIVIDDGSTDDSVAVASRYPVKVIAQPNSGVCAASNNGVRASSGQYVLRLDADDRLCPTYIEETLAALQQNPEAHFAYTSVEYFGTKTGTYPIEPFDSETITERNYVHCSALMRRASFDRAGGYNPNMTRSRYEDWDLWLAFTENGMPGVMVPKPLLQYRQHPVASRATLDLHTLNGLRREMALAVDLQTYHPGLFAPTALLKRLGRLPKRLARGEVTPRFALLLTGFYGTMLARSTVRRMGRLKLLGT